jgi:hypothetical protein
LTKKTFEIPYDQRPWGVFQYVLLIDTKGKLWELEWVFHWNMAYLYSIDHLFPADSNYALRSITCAIRSNGDKEMWMITDGGVVWFLGFIGVNGMGVQVLNTNLSGNINHIVSCSNLAASYVHLFITDDDRRLWYHLRYNLEPNPGFYKQFRDVIANMKGKPSNGCGVAFYGRSWNRLLFGPAKHSTGCHY